MDAEQREPAASTEEPTVIFDPAKLTAQLSELLELYLARAKEALLEEQMSSKDAVACAKQVSSMLEDTQSGKLQQVDTTTHWPRLEFAPAAFVGRGPVPRRPASCRDNHGGPQVAALQDPPIQSLENAVSAVCQYDEETAILEPWAQLLARMNKLTQRVAADIEAWKASCEEQPPLERVGRAHQPGSSAPATEEGGSGSVGACPPSHEPCDRRAQHAVPVQQSPKDQPSERKNLSSGNKPSSPLSKTPPNRGRDARATDSSPAPAGDWKLEAGSGFT